MSRRSSLSPEQRRLVPDAAEPVIAYVYGDDTPPDFASLAAFGFEIVCLDSTAPWFNETLVAAAAREGLSAFAFSMRYLGPQSNHG